ncbi:MAG TPA: AraC family transcriptional regulator [Oscillospiraceae bacterium]|nr:AraC family transcriptional regulator [Oscillospiraceae bacterium]HPF55586.1 AraC family transcriptional regulator [Clostridiales bacterium]HPK35821.1 AraC family transcriptional regulator [Oscillospiraceae bacterium]HPR76339.1 AraC family transcriptional regulator [Oscillospiraceae bacterium]
MVFRLEPDGDFTVNLIGHSICAQGWHIPDRILQDIELIVVYRGVMRCRVGENEYDVHEGEVILVPPGEVFYQSSPEGPCRFFYTHFSAPIRQLKQADIPLLILDNNESATQKTSYFFQLEEPASQELAVCLLPIVKTGKYYDEVRTLFERALLERNRPAAGYKLMISFYIRQILILLSRACIQENPLASKEKEQKKVVQEALGFIHGHYTGEIDIQQLSRRLSVSYQYLARQFKQSTGVSPVKYINRLRIEEAKKRIRTTDRTLEQIAREVGFENGYYFSRVFRQYEGISPSKYRSWLNSRNNQ